jgi:hypothetical protein
MAYGRETYNINSMVFGVLQLVAEMRAPAIT